MAGLKFPPPRQLEHQETLDTLDQFKSQFRLFYKRSDETKEFFAQGARWNSTQANYGLQGGTNEDRAARSDNLEMLLTQVAAHLPFPYLTQKLVKDTKNFEDVWSIIYSHYGVKPSQSSFIQYAQLRKKADETPMTFYERLSHHARAHLAPAGAILDGTANAAADTFSLSLKNHITLDWLRLLDPRLLDIVQTEYGTELKSGTQLAALVPKIAHNLDSLLKRHSKPNGNGNGESVNLVKEESPDDTTETSETILYLNSSGNWVRGGFTRGRGNRGNGNYRGSNRGGYGRASFSNDSAKSRYCPNCKTLGAQLGLNVNYGHFPYDCPRKRAAINLVRGEELDFQEEENKGEEYTEHESENNL